MSDEDAQVESAIEAAPDPLQEILNRLKAVEDNNKELAAKNAALEQAMAETAVQSHLLTGDNARSGLRMDVARSVTIPTRPVRENPEQYQHVINLGDVAQRSGNNE